MRVLFSRTQLGPEHEINLRAPYELVKTLLLLMTDVISEGSGEHVCLQISSGSRSLTKFKVDEDSRQIKILDIYFRCCPHALKYLSAVF